MATWTTSLLYVHDGVRKPIVYFKLIDNFTSVPTFFEIRSRLYFLRNKQDELVYIEPEYFSEDKIAGAFTKVLPEEVDE